MEASTGDFKRAAEVRRAMMRAPWPPLALKLAVLIFDYMGLARGRSEVGLGSLARDVIDVDLAALDDDEARRRVNLTKRSVKRALAALGDVLVTEEQGPGKRAHRWLRTDLILERWGVTASSPPPQTAGVTVSSPPPDGRGDRAVTPGVTVSSPHGVTVRSPGTKRILKEDLLEAPPLPPAPPVATADRRRDRGGAGSVRTPSETAAHHRRVRAVARKAMRTAIESVGGTYDREEREHLDAGLDAERWCAAHGGDIGPTLAGWAQRWIVVARARTAASFASFVASEVAGSPWDGAPRRPPTDEERLIAAIAAAAEAEDLAAQRDDHDRVDALRAEGDRLRTKLARLRAGKSAA